MIRTATIAAAAALVLGIATPAAAQSGCQAPQDANVMATNLLSLTNGARSGRGHPNLQIDRRLSVAAQTLACDIQRTGQISHVASDGSTSGSRVRRAGYQHCIVAENLAWGYPRPSQIANGWLNSSGHNRNMLHPRAREFGVGLAQGGKGPIWVMIYATPC